MHIFAPTMYKYTTPAMKIKAQRFITIKQLITSQKVASQEELLMLLDQKGFRITQATLSRDLKFLKVVKVADAETGYCYVMTDNTLRFEEEPSIEDFPMTGIETVEFSGPMAVIKTRPGFAMGIASVIDSHGLYEILGTIAGDDTILLVNREGVSRSDVVNALSLFIPGLKDKIL